MKKIGAGIIFAAMAVFSLLAGPSQAREVIKNYDVSIEIKEDRSMIVTERITASAERREIKKGIIRSFPVVYVDDRGRKVSAGFKVLGAEIDGKPTGVSVSSAGSYYKEARIGDPDKILSIGDHTFTITYQTTRQLGSFEEYDELYWNVTGNEWIFPILSVSCSVKLPGRNSGEGFDTIEWYTGKYGQKGGKSDAMILPDGTVRTARALAEGEGLTVVYTWPKGIIAPPPADNFTGQAAAGAATMALILIWFIYDRRKYGDSTDNKAIIPLFNPPNGVSPASARCIYTMDMDDTSFTAAIIGLAVKGALTIKESDEKGLLGKSGDITLVKEPEAQSNLTSEEQALMNDLFRSGSDSLKLKQSSAGRLRTAMANLRRYLKTFRQQLINNNVSRMFPAMVIYALGAAAFCLSSPVTLILAVAVSLAGGVIILVSLPRKKTFPGSSAITPLRFIVRRVLPALMGASLAAGLIGPATTGTYFLIAAGLLFVAIRLLTDKHSLRSIPATAAGTVKVAILAAAATFLYISGWISIVTLKTSWPLVLLPISAVAIASMRTSLITYTDQGAELVRGIQGLMLYMNVAEKDRLQMLNPPEETPRLFERLLPYALALGIEKTWGDRFEKVLRDAQYIPTWYAGPSPHIFMSRGGLNSFSSNLGRQVTSSMRVPSSSGSSGSSRGGGGGGFSGGGRGGGGGRGW